ncbi:hypothetical protein KR038_003128, partial [Drosophila bunnanda]
PGTKARPASSQAAASIQSHPLTPLMEAPEQEEEEEETAGASNNNTIMGKMKKRLSILPAALSGWFSPSSKPDAAASPQQEPHRQANGCSKRKRGRRRIVLAEADAEADDVDDGSDARGLDYEEVALADNITEHDLAAEDEQRRRSEYNVFLLRRQQDALAATGGGGEEDDVEEDEEDEECDEEDDDDVHEQVAKRQRLKLETTVSLPHMRRMPLGSSTPAASLVPASVTVGGSRSNSSLLAPHRRTHLNLYQNQRNREPAFNFFAGNETAAEGTTGDLPHSIRRSLNIPFGSVAGGGSGSCSSSVTSRNNSSLSLSSLPNHKRPSLLGKRTEFRDRNLIDCTGDRQRDLIINNNNNNVEKPSRQTDLGSASTGASGVGGDSNSESDPVELNFHDNGEAHHNHNNSRLEFYGNLLSNKSLFNRSSAKPTLHNSTWSLNSLSNRRTFNATIYGSTSALSDSRLLSHRGSAASSVSSSSSPFYQGPTAFGGNSANNRFFNRSSSAASSLLAINTRTTMPVQLTGLKPTEMRCKNPAETSGGALSSRSGSTDNRNPAMSKTTHRILDLLDRYSTPLIDVKRMGSTLKEHQSSRRLRDNAPAGSPYSVPRNSSSITGSLQSPNAGLAELRSNKLLLPTMQQLLERRCLNRVTTNTRNLIQSQRQSVAPAQDSDVKKAATKTVPSSVAATTAAGMDQPQSHSHRTNKMRSKLSHQTGRSKETREEEAAPPPPDLPQITFPDMASTPKFDLVIDKTSLNKAIVPASTASKSENNTSTSTKPNFLVNPHPLNAVSFAANGSATAKNSVFTFAKPTPLSSNSQDQSVAESSDAIRGFSFSAPSPLDKKSEHPPTNGLPPQGFGEQFKKSGKEWDCDVCMVRNKAEAAKCVACETAKPAAASKTAPAASKAAPAATLFEQFKKSNKEWDCDVCMVRNKVESSKCVACETPKPGAAKAAAQAAPSSPAPIVPIGAGFGDRFKKSASAWECEACMVTNKEKDSKCIACMTPRKAAKPTNMNNFPLQSVSGVGFGDAFKVKAGQWECQTCMLMNEPTAVECVACQSANPRLGSTNSKPSSSSVAASATSTPASPHAVNSVSSSTSFKFGFTPGIATAPKPDAGFQQLVASQKAASWNCDACLAQNDMSRNKCVCCEQLKPGSSPSSSGLPVCGGGNSVPKFTFGFAHAQLAKSGAAKEETKATTATSSTEETDSADPAPTPALPQFVFKAPTTSSSASSSTATTTTTTTTATGSGTPALAGFSFGAPSSSSSTVSSSSASSMPTAKPMFSFSGTGSAGAVSSTSSQQPAPKTETLSFGATNTITTTSSTGFSLKPAATPAPATGLTFAAIPASASASAPAPAAAAAASPSFSFAAEPKTVSTPAAAGTFFGAQPTAGTPAAPANNAASVGSIFGSTAAANTNTAASSVNTISTVVSSAAAVTPSNPLLFSFGAANKPAEETTAAKPFIFGSGGLGAAATTTMPSFGWPSNGATGISNSNSNAVTSTAAVSSSQGIMMAQPVFASSTAMFGAPSSNASSSSLFGSTATTAAATPAAVNLGGNGGLATVYGNVGNSLVAPVATAAATPAAAAPGPLANIFGNPTAIAAPASSTSVFGSGTGGFGQGAAAVTTPALGQGGASKPKYNFGGAAAATATSSGAPFNFGSSTAAAAKPAFNFTGSVTASTPQAGAFTFTANPTA